ncbi:outer membrane beta-barrel protein [Bacteroides sp. 519]|uniref:outer membrane beta-barrel protein n=1 Tax=Bacteroides sp. 519 TaxID=2302937 RepID=UPI0013D3B5F8|nr:outer membrane beta-barrel protein [Bacteroides sp. 519]NDV59607.1 porin family protein [Bacteroides sp. 519]
MKQDDELWMKKMKEMLQDYNEPAPPGVWNRIDKELSPPVERKIQPYRWWGVAAAVLLLAVSGVSYYFLHTPVADNVRLTDVPVVTSIPDVIPVTPQQESVAEQLTPAKETTPKQYIALANKLSRVIGEEENRITEPQIDGDEKDETGNREPQTPDNDSNNLAAEKDNSKRNTGKRTDLENHTPIVNQSTSRKKWAIGLSVNSGTTSLLDNDQNSPIIRSTSSLSVEALSTVSTNSTGYVDLSDKNLVYKEGTAQIAESERQKNHIPITVGLSLRKEITNAFSVETGLTYTFLKSDIYQNGQQGETKGEQKLHYIGIPLRGNWDFVKSKNFTVYLSAGGMIEKCVYGKRLDKDIDDKPLQFSLNGSVGAQYNLSKQIGLYVEPGVSYFFDDGTDIETIRKETPFNFNLQAGIRFTY